MLEPHGLTMPQARERLIQILARPAKSAVAYGKLHLVKDHPVKPGDDKIDAMR